MNRIRISCFAVCTAQVLSACSSGFWTTGITAELADITPTDWDVSMHRSAGPPVMSAAPRASRNASSPMERGTLVVYIEGDGRAWLRRDTPSDDPTPVRPVALHLAAADGDSKHIAYLARPCQYEARTSDDCEPASWTNRRYGRANLESMSAAIDTINSDGRPLILVGYSGGGVMAALLAIHRSDVVGFTTVAANMDTAYWTRHHSVSMLEGSLEPMAYASRLAVVPQVHLYGGGDRIVPSAVLSSYLAALGLDHEGRTISRPSFDHSCCWADDWGVLRKQAMDLLYAQVKATGRTR